MSLLAPAPNTLSHSLLSFARDRLRESSGGGAPSPYASYVDDPTRFFREVLLAKPTRQIRRVLKSLREHPITIVQSANAVGKTWAAARAAIWFYSVYPKSQVYTAAASPEGNLKRLLWGEIGSVIRETPYLFASDKVLPDSMLIERNSSSYIAGVTIPLSGSSAEREARFSGKHAPQLLFVVDEADAVPDEVFRGIEACISGGLFRILLLYNPREETGLLARMIADGSANVVQLNAFGHPNVRTGTDAIPGAVTRETTVRRVNEWSRPIVAGEYFDPGETFRVPSFLVGATAKQGAAGNHYPPLPAGRRVITVPQLAYMVLGRYPAVSDQQLISTASINMARSRWDAYVAVYGELPPKGVSPFVGQDVAELGNDASVTCIRWGGFVGRFLAWHKADILTTGTRCAQIAKDVKAAAVFVDANGVGAGVVPILKREGVRGVERVMPQASAPQDVFQDVGEFGITRDFLWWAVREWLRTDSGAMLPPDEELIEELKSASYSVTKGKLRVSPKDAMKATLGGRSPDRADALCLTFARAAGSTADRKAFRAY
jgi:hypothetical protein